MECIEPNYNNGSLVNLVASLQQAMGITATAYAPLDGLNISELSSRQNIVFILIDGLGLRFIERHGQNSFIASKIQRSMTSMFPSTTATVVTTLSTGVAAAQHAVTGWFMYLQEAGMVSAILPYIPRIGGQILERSGVPLASIVDTKPIYPRLKRTSTLVYPEFIVDSVFSKNIGNGAQRVGFDTVDKMFGVLRDRVKKSRDPQYLYAYWTDFDYRCHEYGCDSERAIEHFKEIDRAFESFCKALAGLNCTVLLTADHGLINTSQDRVLHVEIFPEIANMLRLPLCGEPRTAYCYVKADYADRFSETVKHYWGEYCDVYRSEEIIQRGLFGHDIAQHPQLRNRIGDFVLMMKDNYIVKDRLLGEKPFKQVGVHGGLSDQEMLVPLVVVS